MKGLWSVTIFRRSKSYFVPRGSFCTQHYPLSLISSWSRLERLGSIQSCIHHDPSIVPVLKKGKTNTCKKKKNKTFYLAVSRYNARAHTHTHSLLAPRGCQYTTHQDKNPVQNKMWQMISFSVCEITHALHTHWMDMRFHFDCYFRVHQRKNLIAVIILITGWIPVEFNSVIKSLCFYHLLKEILWNKQI